MARVDFSCPLSGHWEVGNLNNSDDLVVEYWDDDDARDSTYVLALIIAVVPCQATGVAKEMVLAGIRSTKRSAPRGASGC